MKIEYDDLYKKWVVWMIKGSLVVELFKSKTKKDCISFVKKEEKRNKRVRKNNK